MLTHRSHLFVAGALLLGAAATTFAAPGPPTSRQAAAGLVTTTPVPDPEWPWQEGVLTLGPASFQVRNCLWAQAYLEYEMDKTLQASFRVTPGYAFVSMTAPVHLPLGAQITRVKIDYFDSEPDSEPSMGVYGLGPTGEAKLIADTSGVEGFYKGNNTVTYKVALPNPNDARTASTYEFLVTLNRSLNDVTLEHALYRVEIRYRYRAGPSL